MSETYVFTGTFAIAAESEAYARDGLMELLAEIVRDDDSLPFDLVLDEEAALRDAAPELLGALEAVIGDLQEAICIAEDEGADEAWLAGAKARRAAASAAIAKARGA